ncbi:MAG TPA: HU family DNA-binding protein [Blastocatellia bacterium]|nr:HU family DNA-binding protein [Blastocatellia bacterium]
MAAAKKMTKTQLTKELAKATGTDTKTVQQFIETLSAIAYREADKSGEFNVPGLGKFVHYTRRTIKDSPVRGTISESRIRAAVLKVSRLHPDYRS